VTVPRYDRLVFDDDVDIEEIEQAERALDRAGVGIDSNDTENGRVWRLYRDSPNYVLEQLDNNHASLRIGGDKVARQQALESLIDAGVRFDTGSLRDEDNRELCREWLLDHSIEKATVEFGFCHRCERQSCGANHRFSRWSK